MDDNSNSFSAAVALNGITTIAPGESVIFLESDTPATVVPAFKTLWFGANPPPGLQIGTYSGSGVGLSTSADAVNLYNSAGVLQPRSPSAHCRQALRSRTRQCRRIGQRDPLANGAPPAFMEVSLQRTTRMR
jgi:hypothetical protein